MTLSQLKNTRNLWYNAFYAGDVTQLKQLQTENFIVVTEKGTQSRRSQIDYIQAACALGEWFPQDAERRDIDVRFNQTSDGYEVAGTGYTLSGDTHGSVVRFSEHWTWNGENWQVTALHYEPVEDQAQA